MSSQTYQYESMKRRILELHDFPLMSTEGPDANWYEQNSTWQQKRGKVMLEVFELGVALNFPQEIKDLQYWLSELAVKHSHHKEMERLNQKSREMEMNGSSL